MINENIASLKNYPVLYGMLQLQYTQTQSLRTLVKMQIPGS